MTTLSEKISGTAPGDEAADTDAPEAAATEFDSTVEDALKADDIAGGSEEESVAESDEHDEEHDDEHDDDAESSEDETQTKSPIRWTRVVAFGVLPGIALVLALAAGYFKWVALSGTEVAQARTESVRVAGEDAVAMLSYTPDSAERDLGAARERLTGEFKDAYSALTRQVVIPGAKDKRIAAVAKVNAAASVSATADHAVVLLYVNQTVTVGDGGTPTDTQPVIRVVLDKVDGRWLVSHFDPV